MGFFSELKRRNVYRVGALYVVVAWLLLQVVDVLGSVLQLPAWVGKTVALLLAVGLPVSLILAWAFEMTPQGVVRDRLASADNKGPSSRKTMDYLILAVLVVAVGWFAWQHPWGEERPVADPANIQSLVVLPLDNLMNDETQAYFVDGMHDAIIAELSRIGALRVISRTSANRYRDTNLPLSQIAQELGVDAVVEGSVLRAGDTVRINVQLIDARADQHLWGGQFDRDLGDILNLYADVTRRITDQIQVQLSSTEQAHLDGTGTVNAEAYDRYLQGIALCDRWSRDSMLRGIEQLRALTREFPDDARALSALALCLQYAGFFDYVEILEIRDEARTAAQRAVRLAPELSLAQVASAATHWYLDFDAEKATLALQRALEINPGNARALILLAWRLSEIGRFEEAQAAAARAIEIDPFSNGALQALGQTRYLARDFEGSLESFLQAVEMDPSDPGFYPYPAWAYTQLGRHEEAIVLLEKAVELSGGAPFHLGEYGMGLAFAGREAEAMQILDQLTTQSGGASTSPFQTAQIHMALGNTEAALDGLERALEARDSGVFYLATGAQFDGLRGEPRFEALVERMMP